VRIWLIVLEDSNIYKTLKFSRVSWSPRQDSNCLSARYEVQNSRYSIMMLNRCLRWV